MGRREGGRKLPRRLFLFPLTPERERGGGREHGWWRVKLKNKNKNKKREKVRERIGEHLCKTKLTDSLLCGLESEPVRL